MSLQECGCDDRLSLLEDWGSASIVAGTGILVPKDDRFDSQRSGHSKKARESTHVSAPKDGGEAPLPFASFPQLLRSVRRIVANHRVFEMAAKSE